MTSTHCFCSLDSMDAMQRAALHRSCAGSFSTIHVAQESKTSKLRWKKLSDCFDCSTATETLHSTATEMKTPFLNKGESKPSILEHCVAHGMFHLQALILAEGRANQLQPEFSVVTAMLYQFGRDGFAFLSLSSIRWFATTGDDLTCFCSACHCRQEVAASSAVDIEIQSANIENHITFCTEQKLQLGRTGKVAKQIAAQWSNSSRSDEVLSGFNRFNGFNVPVHTSGIQWVHEMILVAWKVQATSFSHLDLCLPNPG